MIRFRQKKTIYQRGVLGGFQPPPEWKTLKDNPPSSMVQILPLDRVKLSLNRTRGKKDLDIINIDNYDYKT